MKIEIDVTLEDAILIKQWMEILLHNEIMYTTFPQNHRKLFCTLVIDSIEKEAKKMLQEKETLKQ